MRRIEASRDPKEEKKRSRKASRDPKRRLKTVMRRIEASRDPKRRLKTVKSGTRGALGRLIRH